jgi:hypothetical protein
LVRKENTRHTFREINKPQIVSTKKVGLGDHFKSRSNST